MNDSGRKNGDDKVPAPPQREDFDSLELFHEAMAVWRCDFDKMVASYKDEFEAMFSMDTSHWPEKSWAKILEENPNHAGGLAQMAEAEARAIRCRNAVERFLIRVTRLPKHE